jgi:hypothetical protein
MVMSELASLNSAPLNCAQKTFLRQRCSCERETPRDKPVASARAILARGSYAYQTLDGHGI